MTRTLAFPLLAALVAAPCAAPTEGSSFVHPLTMPRMDLPVEGEMPSFGSGNEWLNSAPLEPAQLRGKVVLVDFWTYSCINWRRHAPYVRAWAEAYAQRGLVVIGVHSPEFGFESSVDNVRRAVAAMGIPYPVVIDNDHSIWRAFGNQAWPALFFVDAKGHIRHRYYGEGEYDQCERILQQLLAEAGCKDTSQPLASITPRGVEAAADWASLGSPETYVGYARLERFASPGGPKRDKPNAYTSPSQLALNQWALEGDWRIGRQAAAATAANARIVFRFRARDLHLVMGPSASARPARFRVLLDGHAPGPAHGLDVDGDGNGKATEHRLYQLIRQPGAIVGRTFEIDFPDGGAEAFSFTFG